MIKQRWEQEDLNNLVVGFIGVGAMGRPMATNLLKKGLKVVVFDTNSDAVRAMTSTGAIAAGSLKELADQASIIITMLPTPDAVEQVALGSSGLVEWCKPGHILAEMSTTGTSTLFRVADGLSKAGVDVVDAPVSGTPDIAERGELTVMVGGKDESVEKCMPVFKALGKTIIKVGKIGDARIAKLANNFLLAINSIGAIEVVNWVAKTRLGLEKLYEITAASSGNSKAFERIISAILQNGSYLKARRTVHKDLSLALEEAVLSNAPAPIGSLVLQLIQSSINLSNEGETLNSSIKLYTHLSGKTK